jgi:hypothetical protein
MTRRVRLGIICALTALGAGGALASSAAAAPSVSIVGTVGAPATYSAAQLAAMTQTTETISGHTYQGVLLFTLVNGAAPVYPSPLPKNPTLRVIVTATSDTSGATGGPVTFGLGEFDTNFGNNQALIALTDNGVAPSGGPRLVLPRDTASTRFVDSVSQINVAVRNLVHSTPPAGGVNVQRAAGTTTLTATQLAALPQTTLMISFLAGTSPTNDTENGPILSDVLTAAGVTPDANTYVAAVAPDDYVAAVTPAEATIGARPLMLSTSETVTATGAPTTNTPRLVTSGDVKGGRYVSNVTDLVVGEGAVAPPTASSGGAFSVTASGAGMSGTVNATGLPTSYVFEYGPTLSFGSISTPISAGSGTAATPVSATLSGLAPQTTYFYRLVTTSSAGTAFGIVRSFTTAGTPLAPSAVTLPASAMTNTTASLAGQVNPHGQQTAFTFEYGTSQSFGSISPVVALDAAAAPESVSATISGLMADTTYYYRLVASNATGPGTGAVMTFSTGPGGVPIVTTGTASAITSSGATLSATVNPHGSQTAFTFEYGLTNAFGSISVVDNAGSTNGVQSVSLPITGLMPATTYRFRIVATNAAGMAVGTVQNVTTAAAA